MCLYLYAFAVFSMVAGEDACVLLYFCAFPRGAGRGRSCIYVSMTSPRMGDTFAYAFMSSLVVNRKDAGAFPVVGA